MLYRGAAIAADIVLAPRLFYPPAELVELRSVVVVMVPHGWHNIATHDRIGGHTHCRGLFKNMQGVHFHEAVLPELGRVVDDRHGRLHSFLRFWCGRIIWVLR